MPRKYTVTGRGDFPHDMLRYDNVDFASAEDRAIAGTGYVSARRSVNVVGERWTIARWNSFGWSVTAGDPIFTTNATTFATTPAPTAEEIVASIKKTIDGLPKPMWAMICPDGTVVTTPHPREILAHLMRTCPVEQLFPQGGGAPYA